MWPDGEAIIGKSLVISAALFSSKNFGEDYAKYAAEVANPQYQVQPIMGESEFSARLSPDADVSIRNLSDSDEVLLINVVNPEDDSGYGALYSVNKERLIISLNCDYFELAKRRK